MSLEHLSILNKNDFFYFIRTCLEQKYLITCVTKEKCKNTLKIYVLTTLYHIQAHWRSVIIGNTKMSERHFLINFTVL